MTVEEKIASLPDGPRQKFAELRNIITSALPGTTETLKWNAPAILHKDGMILVVYSAHKDHMNLVVTPSTIDVLKAKLKEYETGKGSVKLVYDKPLPTGLIKELVTHRAEEYEKNGVKWKA